MRKPNDFEIKGEYAEIILRGFRGQEKGRAKVDLDDLERVLKIRWCFYSPNYATTSRALKMHQFIVGKKKGFEIDHINGDGLDNRKSNLRHLTHRDNMRNRSRAGVFWQPHAKKWRLTMQLEGKNRHLGYFLHYRDAMVARRNAEIKFWGEGIKSRLPQRL